MKAILRAVAIPLAVSFSLATSAAQAPKMAKASGAEHTKAMHIAGKGTGNGVIRQKLIVKEAADAFKATQAALVALNNNRSKEALAALEVVSGNLHLLLARIRL